MSKRDNAVEVLRGQHREVQKMFHRFEGALEKEQARLCREIVDALKLHTRIEEEVFYPYIREATGCAELMEEASVEHGAAKQLISDLESGHDGVHRHAVVKVLSEYVGHHIKEEEERIFPLVEKSGVDLEALGRELMEHEKQSSSDPGTQFSAQAHSREEDEAFVKAYSNELSPSARRAKWIHSPDEREEHPGQTLATRNPAVIRAWAEARKGRPATSPGGDPRNPRVLRFDFPDYDKGLQPLSWETWFRVFEDRNLVFLFQEHMKAGNQSNFFRLDSPEREEG